MSSGPRSPPPANLTSPPRASAILPTGSGKRLASSASAPAVGRGADQLADPSYRLAAARSTEHREQELSWQWHVYRLATAKQKIDAQAPRSFTRIRDPEKAALHAKINSAAALRQHEIAMANNALVSRIRTQKSTYHSNFQQEHNSTSPLVREHKAKSLDADARNGTNTSRLGGSSGINFGSTANRKEQKRIQADNHEMLRALKRINSTTGPYNKEKCNAEIEQHERLVRRRLPRIMHVHPRNTIATGGKNMRPPIHFSVLAAHATSPNRLLEANSPTRKMGEPTPEEEGANWREYYAKRGLDEEPSAALSRSQLVPTIENEESKEETFPPPSFRSSPTQSSSPAPLKRPTSAVRLTPLTSPTAASASASSTAPSTLAPASSVDAAAPADDAAEPAADESYEDAYDEQQYNSGEATPAVVVDDGQEETAPYLVEHSNPASTNVAPGAHLEEAEDEIVYDDETEEAPVEDAPTTYDAPDAIAEEDEDAAVEEAEDEFPEDA